MKNMIRKSLLLIVLISCSLLTNAQQKQWIVYQGKEGPGKGKHIVFISGDEEYRSEEGLPMLAKILSQRHGFKCTVLFSIDPKTNKIDPDVETNIPGMQALQSADLIVMLTRFRELPDEQMKYFDEYVKSGKPIIGMRTATHAFQYIRNKQSPYAKYSYNSDSPGWKDGFGRRVFGETWVDHHGSHGKEGTRALINGVMAKNSILKGVKDIWGSTDVYAVRDLPENTQVLLYGQSTHGMTADSPLSYEKSIMPVAWIRTYTSESGKQARIFNTTMGAATDLVNEDLRRLIVNACYWATGMDQQIPEKNNVEIAGDYNPTAYGFKNGVKGMSVSDFELK
jgi:type 1 glutamine amidotransferase